MSKPKRIIIVGLGNLGQAILPLLQDVFPQIPIIAFDQHCDRRRVELAARWHVDLKQCRISAGNYQYVLGEVLEEADFLLNLAHEVSSAALLQLAQSHGAFYLDTGIEPWQYRFDNRDAGLDTSNFALREQVLALKARSPQARTAIIAHGANPGFVSILVKQALWDMATRTIPSYTRTSVPSSRLDWARLAAQLKIRVIQISECDTQYAPAQTAHHELHNTWSVDGFVTECRQHAELGWGSHEPALPVDAIRQGGLRGAYIQLQRPGWQTRVRSWSPLRGEFEAILLTHHEAISITSYFTVDEADQALYRPTVYYAYRPPACAMASMQMIEQDSIALQGERRVLKEEIRSGVDELGVLLISEIHGGLWYGSALSIERARALAPLNNATSLQVVSSVVGAMRWAIDHPDAGIVEAEEMDHDALIAYTRHFWEPMQCVATAWTPLHTASRLDFAAFRYDGDRYEKYDREQALVPMNELA